jgi:hypothetical protein
MEFLLDLAGARPAGDQHVIGGLKYFAFNLKQKRNML